MFTQEPVSPLLAHSLLYFFPSLQDLDKFVAAASSPGPGPGVEEGGGCSAGGVARMVITSPSGSLIIFHCWAPHTAQRRSSPSLMIVLSVFLPNRTNKQTTSLGP